MIYNQLKNNKYLLPILIFIIISYSNANEWINYYMSVKSIVCSEDDYVWIGTDKGVVKFDKTTNEKTYYNTYNSDLPNNNIFAIGIDSSGNKWIATRSGMVKFDNTNWTICNTGTNEFFFNQIYDITFDNTGKMWLGGEFGLANYDGTKWNILDSLNLSLPDAEINGISVDAENSIWLATKNCAVELKDGAWNIIDTSNSDLPSNYICQVIVDKNDDKWFSCKDDNRSIVNFDGENYTIYNKLNTPLSGESVWALAVDDSNNLWAGDYEGNVFKFDGNTWTSTRISENYIKIISIDKNGDKWFGTGGNDFIKGSGNDYDVYYSGNIEFSSSNGFSNIFIDGANNKYITNRGLYCFELLKFNNNEWEIIVDTSTPGLPVNTEYFFDITIDEDDKVWATTGSDGNILKINKSSISKWSTYDLDIGSSTSFSEIRIDSSDNKWVIAGWKGLVMIDSTDTNIVLYDTSNTPLSSSKFESITIDNEGNKWVGTRDEIAKFDGQEWTIFNSENSTLSNDFLGYEDIAVDNMGVIWFTTNNMIGRFDSFSDTYTEYDDYNIHRACGNSIIDKLNQKWFSTNNIGALMFNDTDWVVYDVNNSGLSNNEIKAIKVDSLNNKWFLHSDGISVFNENGIVNIKEDHFSSIKRNKSLKINYNNSFITCFLPKESSIDLTILNLKGQIVAEIHNNESSKGNRRINISSLHIPNGFYIVQLKAFNQNISRKMLISD